MNKVIELPKQDLRVLRRLDKRQRAFIEAWLSPSSDTFGNAYQSALQAGFKENTARVITGNARNMPWVQEAKELFAQGLEPEHIYQALQHKALNAKADRDQIRALELMAKIKGMFIERNVSEINVKFSNSVPRPTVPSDVIDADTGS